MHVFGLALVMLISTFSVGIDGLYCFKCLAVDCADEDNECQHIRSFIQSELRNLYYFNDYLDPCPNLSETHNWRLMQITDSPCPEQNANEATCTLGRMNIKTTSTDSSGKPSVRINHATILGCANRQLLKNIKTAFSEGKCDISKRNKTYANEGSDISHELKIEHCRDAANVCYEKDYCIDWKLSEVKPWVDQNDKKFEVTLYIGILAVVVVVVLALLIAGLLRDPPNIPSILPKHIGDESETVKVLEFRDKEFSSIEADEGNASSSRRPSVPPPPPPRLHRQLTRESTPV